MNSGRHSKKSGVRMGHRSKSGGEICGIYAEDMRNICGNFTLQTLMKHTLWGPSHWKRERDWGPTGIKTNESLQALLNTKRPLRTSGKRLDGYKNKWIPAGTRWKTAYADIRSETWRAYKLFEACTKQHIKLACWNTHVLFNLSQVAACHWTELTKL